MMLQQIRRIGAHRRASTRPLATISNATAPFVIAVDGPAASGKGALSKYLAKRCNVAHLDTGLLYRLVAYKALQQNVELSDAQQVSEVARHLTHADVSAAGSELRNETVGNAASQVSVIPDVREAVNAFPRAFVSQLQADVPGCVMDGRDVGTVLFPDARLKLFVTASPEVRAQRRLIDLRNMGDTTTTYESVLQAVVSRDARDQQRTVAPLKPAPDAIILDTSDLSLEQVCSVALAHVTQRIPELGLLQSAT